MKTINSNDYNHTWHLRNDANWEACYLDILYNRIIYQENWPNFDCEILDYADIRGK